MAKSILSQARSRLKLALFGFVFTASVKSFIFIFLCFNRAYVHLIIRQIGFVLHKKVRRLSLVSRYSSPVISRS